MEFDPTAFSGVKFKMDTIQTFLKSGYTNTNTNKNNFISHRILKQWHLDWLRGLGLNLSCLVWV